MSAGGVQVPNPAPGVASTTRRVDASPVAENATSARPRNPRARRPAPPPAATATGASMPQPPSGDSTRPVPADQAESASQVSDFSPATAIGLESTTLLASSIAVMGGAWTAPDWPGRSPVAAGEEIRLPADASHQEARVREVLDRYAKAFEQLDVQAAKAVWPAADARQLRRAFHGLDGQQLRFTSCDVSISGQAANVSCHGDATFQPKVGTRPLHATSRQWHFDLSRHEDDGWLIVNATMQ
jgi:hypothetical protein